MAGKARRRERGSALLESTLILMSFLALAIGTLDFAQVLFVRQSLVERVREALRWGIVHPYNEIQIKNMVLYRQPTPPVGVTEGYLGLTVENVSVTYTPPPAGNPMDERVRIAIVNYPYRFFSPWIAGAFNNNNAVVESAAMAYKP